MNKKAQIDSEEILKLIGAIIVLVFLIPIVGLFFDPSIFTSPDKFINNFVTFFIPLFILAIIIEFIRRIVE